MRERYPNLLTFSISGGRMYVGLCMYACMHACMYVMCVCMHAYARTHVDSTLMIYSLSHEIWRYDV